MALLFSAVTVTAGDSEAEFLVGGIPKERNDLDGWAIFDEFMDGLDEGTEVEVRVETYLYGDEETVKASVEEVAYLTIRMKMDSRFLDAHCDNIETAAFSFV